MCIKGCIFDISQYGFRVLSNAPSIHESRSRFQALTTSARLSHKGRQVLPNAFILPNRESRRNELTRKPAWHIMCTVFSSGQEDASLTYSLAQIWKMSQIPNKNAGDINFVRKILITSIWGNSRCFDHLPPGLHRKISASGSRLYQI